MKQFYQALAHKKQLILSMMILLPLMAGAQTNSNEPYFIEEETVVDTIKAIQMAKDIIMEQNEAIDKELVLVNDILKNRRSKLNTDADANIIRGMLERLKDKTTEDNFSYNSLAVYSNYEDVLKVLEKRKIHNDLYRSLLVIQHYLEKEKKDGNIYPEKYFSKVVFPLPTKKMLVKKENPNYGFRWLDRFDTNKLKYNPIKENYKSDDYPNYVFAKCECAYIDPEYYGKIWAVFDKSDNLVAVQWTQYESREEDDIQLAAMKYDYAHNAYDINSESAEIRKALDDWYNDRTVEKQIEALQREQAAVELSRHLAQKMTSATAKSPEEFKAAQVVNKELAQKSIALNSKIQSIKKQMPPKEIQDAVNRYLKQLKEDNNMGYYLHYMKDGEFPKISRKRIDGLNFLITSTRSNIKVKQTYFYDTLRKRIDSKYMVLNK